MKSNLCLFFGAKAGTGKSKNCAWFSDIRCMDKAKDQHIPGASIDMNDVHFAQSKANNDPDA